MKISKAVNRQEEIQNSTTSHGRKINSRNSQLASLILHSRGFDVVQRPKKTKVQVTHTENLQALSTINLVVSPYFA